MRINFNSMTLDLSGGNRFIFELSNALVERGHKVTITHAGLPKQHRWFSPIKAEIIECGYSPFQRALIKFKLKAYSQTERLNSLCASIPDCDVNVATFCLTAKPTFDSGKGEMYYLVQHYEPIFFNASSLNKRIAEESYYLPLKKLCVSEWLVDKVGGTYIGDGINLSRFKKGNAKVPNSVMLMVRQNISWKNPELTLKIAKILSISRFTVFVADGSLSDQELISMYQKSKIFVYLSDKEGFGLPSLEAMACGCVVVSTPCCPFLKDMVNAYIITETSVNSILVAIIKVASNEVLCSLLTSEGFKTALQFDFRNVVSRFEKAIGTAK
jgi:hypothetical protein